MVVFRHDRDPDLDPPLAGDLWVAPDLEMAERRPEELREGDRLLPRRGRPGVDVDEGERRPERGLDPGGPGVDFEGGEVAEPAERRDPIGDDVLVRLARLD